MAYATLADYEARHGTVASSAQINRVTALLEDASALIAAILPSGYTPAAELSRAVCVAVAWRAITNPGGRRSVTVGAVSESYGEDGGLYLTEGERRMLLAAYDADAVTASTIDLRDDGLRSYCPW
ncbi:hypothetical protein [Planobispora rosea]|uniref:hypothetical protein n=1 Tax=Planobispora rosea TaxID=35762 RepID=UPI00114CD62D|nr:hypothetical protein [Planobispora rosea]